MCTHIEGYLALALDIVKYIIQRRKQLHIFISNSGLCKPKSWTITKVTYNRRANCSLIWMDLNVNGSVWYRREHTCLGHLCAFYWNTKPIEDSITWYLATVASYRIEECELRHDR